MSPLQATENAAFPIKEITGSEEQDLSTRKLLLLDPLRTGTEGFSGSWLTSRSLRPVLGTQSKRR